MLPDVHEPTPTSSEDVLFAEAERVYACVDTIVSDSQRRVEALAEIRSSFDKYLEFPVLLDRFVEPIVKRVSEEALNIIQAETSEKENEGEESIDEEPLPHLLTVLYALSKVRGYKKVRRFLPHNVEILEEIFRNLQRYSSAGTTRSEETRPEGLPEHWESIYSLWNWMYALSLVPFSCHVLTDGILIENLIILAKTHVARPGPVGEITAVGLASWLSRPDLESTKLPEFVSYGASVLSIPSNDTMSIVGVLRVIVSIMKSSTSSRETVLRIISPLHQRIWEISEQKSSSMLLRRLVIKYWTRLCGLHMPPRVATWRYQQNRRSLNENLERASADDTSAEEKWNERSIEDDEIVYFDLDIVEDAIDRVLSGLTDQSTAVRWSSAKGIGRISERLPKICGDDVLDFILELFEDVEQDSAWHGACLALAELARRGLLSSRLPEIVPFIVRAIQYDVPRRQSSVGSNVRDAACYVFWAISRAYAAEVSKSRIPNLYASVVVASLLDREVNCRRAASAAFQEYVGRQGASKVSEGISILTTADYFSLGNRSDAYLSITPTVAQYEEFRRPIIDHLSTTKIYHWDPNVRNLSAATLRKLFPMELEYVSSCVIPELLLQALDETHVSIRHGATNAIAELLLADGINFSDKVSGQSLAAILDLVSKIEKKRLYRGKGGELMRGVVCKLIECISRAGLPLKVSQQIKYLDTIDACLPHPSESIQKQAASALSYLTRVYFPVGPKGPSDRLQKRVVDKYIRNVSTNANPAVVRGFSLALGHLPAKLLAPSEEVLHSVLCCLRKTAHPEERVGNEKDAESRRNAILSLSMVCKEIDFSAPALVNIPIVSISPTETVQIFDALFKSLEDYNVDRRGDVGSWSRIASMQCLVTLTQKLAQPPPAVRSSIMNADILKRIVGGILKQFSEKLDSVRSVAGHSLSTIFGQISPDAQLLPESIELKSIFYHNQGDPISINWSNAEVTFPMAMQSANIPSLFPFVIAGLVISVGCTTESVSRASSKSLFNWIEGNEPTTAARMVGTEILSIFGSYERQKRVILPLLRTLHLLMERSLLIADDDFSQTLLVHLKAEAKNCTDVSILFLIVQVMLELSANETVEKAVLEIMGKFLSHRYPRVRKYAAEQFYMYLIEHSSIQNIDESIIEKLLGHPWGAELSSTHARQLSDSIMHPLEVSLSNDSST